MLNLCPHTRQRRFLSVHEYLSMGLLQDAGINVPRFKVASSSSEAEDFARQLG